MMFDAHQLAAVSSSTPRVDGWLRIQEAMRRLLEGTSATYVCVDPRTVAITLAPRKRHWWEPRAAPLEQVTVRATSDSPLLVANRSGSPLLSFGIQDIRQTGATTLAGRLRTIPRCTPGRRAD